MLRQGKPVEMYYYPNEVHVLEHPKALIATWQRNVDWYRFWLQGYENPDPVKAAQYRRWEGLCALQKKGAPERDTSCRSSEP